MSENWVGYSVSLDCGETLGSYQGQISAVDAKDQTITLVKVFQNGTPHTSSSVTLSARDIKDLKIIDTSTETSSNSVSIAKPSVKRTGRSVSESITTTKNNSPMVDIVRKQVAEEAAGRHHSISEGNRTPSKKDRFRNRWTDKNEACFGNHIDNTMDQDFDFEKNLALFNKQAVFDEINASQKPDILRQADSNRQQLFRHDENVIVSAPIIYKQVVVPAPDIKEYFTDAGLIIPSVTPELRNQLFAAAERLGLSLERQTELFGRAATELALQLLGGSHRFHPHNAHQWPTVVALCGAHRQGAAGINCARQLASHGIRTLVYVSDPQRLPALVSSELALYRVTGNGVISNVKDLPSVAVDFIILALEGHNPPLTMPSNNSRSNLTSHRTYALPASWKPSTSSPSLSSVGSSTSIAPVAVWAHENRATVLALDPPPSGTGVGTKISLAPVLPLSHSPENGKIYLCNLAFPLGAFQDVGIKYRSPFGPKFVIPIYPNDA